MAYKEPSFDSKSIKAFMGSYNSGVATKKKPTASKKKSTSKKQGK